MKKTKSVWRWQLRKGFHVVADERGLRWFKPLVYLRSYEEMVISTLWSNRDVIAKTMEGNALMNVLKERNRD